MAKQTTQSIKTHKSGKAAKATLSSKEPDAASIAVKAEASAVPPAPLPEIIHLGIDVHLRQHVVSSYTGLCPSEHSSGGKRRQGCINKHGNPRLRHALVESVRRFIRLQPGWKRLLKVVERLKGDGGRAPANKKKIAVAPGAGACRGSLAAQHRTQHPGGSRTHRCKDGRMTRCW